MYVKISVLYVHCSCTAYILHILDLAPRTIYYIYALPIARSFKIALSGPSHFASH